MRHTRSRIALACTLLGAAFPGVAAATAALPLGTGTACVMMSEAETRAQLGVKKRHAIVCADTGGMVTRILVGRRGRVECTDTIRLHEDRRDLVGAACAGIRAQAVTAAPPVVNLTGTWTAVSNVWTCTDITVEQSGSSISLSGSCGSYGTFRGVGQIDFAEGRFDSSGTATVAALGSCRDALMSGDVTPDGQSITGVVSCDQYSVSFTSTRVR